MARSGGKGFLVALVVALALQAGPLPAQAAFAIRIQGPGGFDQTISDNGPGDLLFDPLASTHTIIVSASIGGYNLSINTAVSNTPGAAPSSFLSLNWFLNSPAVAPTGPVTVTASATGYTFPSGAISSVLTSSVAGTLTGTGSVSAQQWVDLGDNLFAMVGPTPGVHGPFTTPPIFNDTQAVGFIASTSYSITDQVILNLGASSATGGDLTSTVVPEPVTMFLGGTGVLMLGYAARRRLFAR